MSNSDSVGKLLADVARLVAEGLRILSLADKRHWGPDEHEQVRALAQLLDEAKKDFQDLSPLVNGQIYYENDRKHESLEELRQLKPLFAAHVENLRDWSRSGGPINPIWVRETHNLQHQLHRAQRRAARRIFTSEKENSTRCLGAFLVHRKQREWTRDRAVPDETEYQRRYREELRLCNSVGSFRRFGERDIAFVCDFCDGHVVWEDVEAMPSIRTFQEAAASPILTLSPTTDNPHWQATAFTLSAHLEKQVVFAPVAIANHVAPQHRDYLAGLLCPYCEGDSAAPQEDYDDEDAYRPNLGHDDLSAFEEHLVGWHTTTAPTSQQPTETNSCKVM